MANSDHLAAAPGKIPGVGSPRLPSTLRLRMLRSFMTTSAVRFRAYDGLLSLPGVGDYGGGRGGLRVRRTELSSSIPMWRPITGAGLSSGSSRDLKRHKLSQNARSRRTALGRAGAAVWSSRSWNRSAGLPEHHRLPSVSHRGRLRVVCRRSASPRCRGQNAQKFEGTDDRQFAAGIMAVLQTATTSYRSGIARLLVKRLPARPLLLDSLVSRWPRQPLLAGAFASTSVRNR